MLDIYLGILQEGTIRRAYWADRKKKHRRNMKRALARRYRVLASCNKKYAGDPDKIKSCIKRAKDDIEDLKGAITDIERSLKRLNRSS